MGARGRAVLLSDGGSLSLTAEEPGLECKAFFTRVIGAEHLRIHEHLPSIGAKWYVSMSMRYVQFLSSDCGTAFKFHLEHDISILWPNSSISRGFLVPSSSLQAVQKLNFGRGFSAFSLNASSFEEEICRAT